MADGLTAARPGLRALPKISFGPYGLLQAVPWLMLASAMRFVAYGNPVLAIPCYVLAALAIFLAFLIAANRMIELADGATGLGKLDFKAQLRLAGKVLRRVAASLFVTAFVVYLTGAHELALDMLAGFDGIAFDQSNKLGIVWSVYVATVVLLMVVRAGEGGDMTLADAQREINARWRYIVPAIALLGGLLITMSMVQLQARGLVALYFQTDAPQSFKNLAYFFFVFGFATLRLWMTLAVLVFALRESYRASAG